MLVEHSRTVIISMVSTAGVPRSVGDEPCQHQSCDNALTLVVAAQAAHRYGLGPNPGGAAR